MNTRFIDCCNCCTNALLFYLFEPDVVNLLSLAWLIVVEGEST